jgi:hypothetical protein
MMRPDENLQRALEVIGESAQTAGRDPGSIGMEGRVTWAPDDPDKFVRQVEKWREAGATHLTIDTMRLGLATVDDHIAAVGRAADLILNA